MKQSRLKVLSVALALGAVVCLPAMAEAITTGTLNFDDIVISAPGYGSLPTNYGGFTWSFGTWLDVNNAHYRTHNNTFDFPSNPNAAYSSSITASISSPVAFNFVGAYFSPYTHDDISSTWGADALNVKGYLGGTGGTLVGDQTLTNFSAGPLQWNQLDFNNIDTLVFTATTNMFGSRSYVMDKFITSAVAPVPIPSTLLLLGSGLVGMAGIGRRRLRK